MESWFCSPLLSIIRSFFQGADMRFSHSLKLNHIFRRLYRSGKNAANRYLVLYCRGNGSKGNRIGITVNAKLAHAVHRNRVRRQLREIYRLHEQEFQPGPRPCRGGALARDRRAVWEAGGGISRAGPRSSVCCGRMYEACNAGPHPASISGRSRRGFPRRCRFSPTCSQYALEAISRYGAMRGGWLAFKRLMRCNPFYKGDYFDPVPELPAHPKGGKL